MQFKPPTPLPSSFDEPTVFLAGSIEQGHAVDWQAQAARALEPHGVTVLNPRRDTWEASWEQRITSAPFREQVEWELDGLTRCESVLMYFAPGTQAPITLLELGLVAPSGKLIVSCPDGFWRKGNVEIVCARFGVPVVDELDEAIELTRKALQSR
jgi:hypothetical protein